jgi:hypothetical protein
MAQFVLASIVLIKLFEFCELDLGRATKCTKYIKMRNFDLLTILRFQTPKSEFSCCSLFRQ